MITRFKKTPIVLAVAFIATAAVLMPDASHAKFATVGAVHNYVKQVWDIDVPYRDGIAGRLFNMKYLMQLVDAANLELNGVAISDYANNSYYATSKIATTSVAKEAIDKLIIKFDCDPNAFCFIPENSDTKYEFWISAAGTFYLDWGDGKTETIVQNTAGAYKHSHIYTAPANTHIIKLSGQATGYTSNYTYSVMDFNASSSRIKAMRGCVGCIFPSPIGNNRPSYRQMFKNNSSLIGQIPENLFNGVDPTDSKGPSLIDIFYNCKNLTGPSAKIGDKYLYEIWSNGTSNNAYTGATQLSDYECIPTTWGGPGTKQPGECDE